MSNSHKSKRLNIQGKLVIKVSVFTTKDLGVEKPVECPAGSLAAPCDLFVVVSLQRWVAEDLLMPVSDSGLSLVYAPGFEVPDLKSSLNPAWWMPTELAARFIRAGVDLCLVAPGPHFLLSIPERFLKRKIWSGVLGDFSFAPQKGFCKSAEAKIDSLPAQWYEDANIFLKKCQELDMPLDAAVQVSERLDLEVEYRTFVVNKKVVTSSVYYKGVAWHENMQDENLPVATSFAQEVVDSLEDQPSSYVLDVGQQKDGSWVVIEANPTWSSAFYGCDLREVAKAVVKASTCNSGACLGDNHNPDHNPENHTEEPWRWRIDPYIWNKTCKRQVLRNDNQK